MFKKKSGIGKRIGALVLALALVFGCVGMIPGTDGTIKAEAATPVLSVSTSTLYIGGSSATFKLKNASSKKTIKWSTSNSSVAKIKTYHGTTATVAAGTKTGSATITAAYNGKTYKKTVKTYNNPSLSCSSGKLSMNYGVSTSISVKNISSSTKITASSSNSNFSVSVSGNKVKVKGKKTGATGTITVKVPGCKGGTKTLTQKVYVCTPCLSPSYFSMYKGNDDIIMAYHTGSSTPKWSASNSNISFSTGKNGNYYYCKIKAKKRGSVTVTCKAAGKTMTCKIDII